MSDNYDTSSIKVLTPSEHIQTRKGMYIGEAISPAPLFNEILDNGLDESSSGYSSLTEVVINYDNNCCSVTDHGRGFPQGIIHDPNSGKDLEAVELLCTTAFSGGKFNTLSYRLSSGLNGVGLLVTNSLSDYFKVTTWRDHSEVVYEGSKGVTVSLDKHSTEKDDSGSKVEFIPTPGMFDSVVVPLSHVIMRCKIATAFGMKCTLKVIEKGVERDVDVTSDIYDLMPEDDEGVSEYYRHSFTVKDEDTGESATIAIRYTSDVRSAYRGYTNLLYNSSGGTHHKMMDDAVYSAWNEFDLTGLKWDDIYLGLKAVVAVFISNTEFSSQTKEKLTTNKSYFDKLKSMIKDEIYKWLKDNDEIRESLLKRFHEYRDSKNKLLARKEIKSLLIVNESKGGSVRRTSVVRKLRECSSKVREGTELHIVEGDSALGTIVRARDQRTQACLPIRGKTINVARFDDIKDALRNEEARSIINSVGAGVGDDSDPAKSRYDMIIFDTDADADGLEIRAQLASLCIFMLPNLVKAGMVYTSVPPLYGWKDKSGYHFVNDLGLVKSKDFYRYKGLGEMDPDELWESTLDPSKRRLVRINYPDDINVFRDIMTSSGAKFRMLEDQGVIKYEL